jgi:hypothetical protein
MSAKAIDPKIKRRRSLVRGGLIIAYVLLMALVFVLGKSHTIIIDNKDSVDKSAAAIDGILVSVDGQEPLELYAGDRDIVKVKGQRHKLSIEPVAGGEKTETSLSVPMDEDMLILSVPKFANRQPGFLEPFVQRDEPRPADEQVGNTNAFTSPDAVLPASPDTAPVTPTP